jgi:ATP-binding cassette subfamily C (CFTR/MRP) protein 1
VIIAVTNYWMVIPVVPILIGCIVVQQLFAKSSREVKRLESISRSPLFSYFSETLTGISTIRTYKLQDKFKAKHLQNIDNNLKCWFAHDMSQRWLGIRLGTLGALIVSLTAVVIVATRGMMDLGFAGLSLTYALQISVFISWGVLQSTETETQMNSVERILHYSTLDIENTEVVKQENEPPKSWPEKGEIVFKNFQMRYRSGLELVLKDINL